MKAVKKMLRAALALALALSMLPAVALATDKDYVYISASYDSWYIDGKDGNPVAYIPVALDDLAKVDLADYGLEGYAHDGDGDGKVDVTALHLLIYTHTQIIGKSWDGVRVSGGVGSIFFEEGLFGFSDCNLNYYYNGTYPEVDGWGVTSDALPLQAGDFLDVAAFTSWDFYSDPAFGFHLFADEDGAFTHNYEAQVGEELQISLVSSASFMGSGANVMEAADYTVCYGTELGVASGQVTTDGSGSATVTFDAPGTWYLWVEGGSGDYTSEIVSTPGVALVSVAGGASEPAEPRDPQDVSAVLNATLAEMASTVTAPAFGTNAGEWTVLALARGGYYQLDSSYFAGYYDRIVDTVDEEAGSVAAANGALHASKSTDNSRLIVALSALGKDATSVGSWDLTKPYEDFNWVKKQGLNGVIWALIALDTNAYRTDDDSVRRNCIDYILGKQLADGGWALADTIADPDVTAMALQALYPYRGQADVAAAAEKAFACLSLIQTDNGGYVSGGDENAESSAWVIVACTAWGINPDTDERFVKNGKSVVDALLSHYSEADAAFKHVATGAVNNMATDQSAYALVAYDRFVNNQNALFDMSDVTFEQPSSNDEMAASLSLPASVNAGASFNGIVSIGSWDAEAGYKLIDLVVNVPEGVSVTGVEAGSRLSGGEVSFHLEEETGLLRIVYFDAQEHNDIVVSEGTSPAELFVISFQVEQGCPSGSLEIAIDGMSAKVSSNEETMQVVDVQDAKGRVTVASGVSFSAVCLYEGDGVDLIAADKKAVAVAVTGVVEGSKLTFFVAGGGAASDATTIEMLYSPQISEKTGVASYVALVDAAIEMREFANAANYEISASDAAVVSFGDSNADGKVNAQDALAAVDAWLRKGEEASVEELLALNVNGDSRLNTLDALGIVEAFVDGAEFGVVAKASVLEQ